MSQENTATIKKAKKKLILKLLAFIGTCCLLQFFIVGPIGLIHSQSAEKVSDVIFIVGLLFILPYYPRKRRPLICINFVSFMIIYTLLLTWCHGYHAKRGGAYYYQGQYQEALQSFKKETQIWYLRLRYNYHERKAIKMMAETYCQLEDFDSARDTYNLMIDQYPGTSYVDLAQERLDNLEKGLKIVANYPEQIPEGKEFSVDSHKDLMSLYNIAGTYKHDLNCHTKALEVYTKILGMDIPEGLKNAAKGGILQLRVK